MKTRVNTNIFTLPVPRVLYTIDNMIFFQQVGVMYLTQGDVEVDDDTEDSRAVEDAIYDSIHNRSTFPIDENGTVRDDGCLYDDYIVVGRAGDKVSQYHPAILESLTMDFCDDIPGSYKYAKETLDKYGITVVDERPETLRLDILINSRKDADHYEFISYCHRGCSQIPFHCFFRREEYSDEKLAGIIVEVLEGFFRVYSAPRALELTVRSVKEGETDNERVKQMVAKKAAALCKIV